MEKSSFRLCFITRIPISTKMGVSSLNWESSCLKQKFLNKHHSFMWKTEPGTEKLQICYL